MNSHIVLAHPEIASYNGQLANLSHQTLSRQTGNHTLSDLYGAGFDPREGAHNYEHRADTSIFHVQTEQMASAQNDRIPKDAAREIEPMLACDLLVVHFPLWWFGPPAMLKGWMDRVFVYGRMYTSTMRFDAGIAKGKKMIACVTTGASTEGCSPSGKTADSNLLLWPVLYSFRYLGYEVKKPHFIHGVNKSASKERLTQEKDAWVDILNTISDRPAVPFNADTDFDGTDRLLPDAPDYSPFIRHGA